jgi:SAM-dependent methyltransferase
MVKELAAYYDEDYYAFYGNEGDAPYRYGEAQWDTFFGGLAARIAEELEPDSVLDAGCAIGFLVVALRDRGVEAWGVDVSEWAISQVPERIKPFCSVASLTDEIDGHFDLVTIIEVIEHLPDAVSGPVIANLTRHADAVLFSSTPDGFEEATHVNVRTPDHWARLFAEHGFFRDFGYDATYLSPDAVLFRRGTLGAVEAVVGYERRMWESRTKAQKILDGFITDRAEMVGLVDEYGGKCRTLEQVNANLAKELHDVNAAMADTERRRKAAALAHQSDLLDMGRQLEAVTHELQQVTAHAQAMAEQVAAIEGTRLFRYTAGPRRFYGRLRRLGGRAA